MGWDRGRYYTRSERVNGRVVRQYVGCGKAGELAAEMDARERAQRKAEAQENREEQARYQALDDQLAALDELADMMSRAALVAAGYHQHHRGEWRRKRVRKEN